METTATPSSISRIDFRYRHRVQRDPGEGDRALGINEEEEDLVQEDRNGQPRSRDIMGRDHRFFHRRAAQAATQVVTVNVEVVATVDTNGNLLGQETVATVDANRVSLGQETAMQQTQNLPTGAPAATLVPADPSVQAQGVPVVPSALPEVPVPVPSALPEALPSAPSVLAQALPSVPQVPSVPSVPTVALPSVPSVPAMPSVPAVPPFPSNLVVPTVPAYPFSSGDVVAEAASSTDPAISSPVPTSGPENSAAPAPSPSPSPTISSESNSATSTSTASILPISSSISLDSSSTVSSAVPSTVSSAFSSASSSTLSSPSASQSVNLSSRPSSSETTIDTISASMATASDAATTSYYGGGGGPGNSAAPPAATTAVVTDADAESSPSPLETPQVVGSVVGSLAGAALILAIILLLIRRHKRKRGGALHLTGGDRAESDQPMRQAPPRISTVPSAFIHRLSGMSRSTAETSTSGGGRSFQKVSGRKLPSAFSEGMTSDQFSRGGTMSGSSFYQDDQSVYGDAGFAKEIGKEIGVSSIARGSGQMNIRPSPARTPVIRHPDDVPPFDPAHLSPPQSPNPDHPPRGTLGRSLPSADGSRSSRFTENV